MATNPRIDDLRKRLEKEPQSRLFAQLAEELRKDGELDEAIRVCREGLQKHPNYPSARMTMGRALLDTGDAAAARTEFETVLKTAPDNILASRYLGEALEGMGDAEGAKQRYKLTLGMSPGDKHVTQRLQALEAGPAVAGVAPAAAPPAAAATPAAVVRPAPLPPVAPAPVEIPPLEEPEPPPIKLAEADENFELERPWEAPTVAPVSAEEPTRAYGVMRDVPAPAAPPAPPPPAKPAFGGGAVEYEFESEEAAGTIPFTPALTVRTARPEIPEEAPEPAAAPEPTPPSAASEMEEAVEPADAGRPAQFAELDEMEWEAPSPSAAPRAEPVIQTRFDLEKEAAALQTELTSPTPPAVARPAGGELATPTLAELYFNQGFTDRAVEVYGEVLEREPGNVRARARLTELQALAGHLRAAQGAGGGPEGRRQVIERTIQRLEALMHAMKEVGR